MGKIVVFDNSLESTTYSVGDLKRIMKELHLAQNDEFLNARILEESQKKASTEPNWNFSEVMAVFDSQVVKNAFKRYVFVERLNILSAFNLALDLYLYNESNNVFYPKTEKDMDAFIFLRKRLLLRFESILFQDKVKDITQDSIILVNEFKKEYFLKLPNSVKGLISKTPDNYNLMETYSNEYQFPIAICNCNFHDGEHVIIDGFKNHIITHANNVVLDSYMKLISENIEYIERKIDIDSDIIKIFTSVPENRNIHRIKESNWFNGGCTFKSEFQYGVRGTIPVLKELTDIFVEFMTEMKNKEVFINVPDFKPTKPVDIMGQEYTDLHSLLRNNYVYDLNIAAIIEAVKITQKQVNIVIPMIRLSDEMGFWRSYIESSFENEKVDVPQIGMMVETESSLEYFEYFEKQEFTIIGLDNLIEELMDGYNMYSDIKYEDFKFDLLNDLRYLHQHYRSYHYKTRHIVSGHCLKNPVILRKLIKLGFKEFVIPIDCLPDVGNQIIEHINTRGTFKGVAANRVERKLQRKQEKAKRLAEKKEQSEKEEEEKKKIEERKKKFKLK